VDIEEIMVDRPFPQGRADRVEGPQVLEQTVVAVWPRLEQRAKDLRAATVPGTGIRAAAEVRVEQEAVMQGTVDPVCWFRFWVVIFTGVVVAVAAGIAVMAGTAASEAVVEGLSAQLTEGLG
jgi:hypothetical protein